MFPRLAEHYRSVVQDLVMSLQALASGLKACGMTASCYTCGDGEDAHDGLHMMALEGLCFVQVLE